MRRTASDARCGSCGGIVANGSSNFGYGGLEPFSLNQLSVAINTEGFSNLSSARTEWTTHNLLKAQI